MCVIAVSEKGKDIPSVEQLKSMWKKNPDGAGYAFVGRNGKVFYRKGFMTLDSLLEELKNPEKFKNTLFAVHFRIGTSGKNDSHTCHPFPVSTHYEDLRRMEGKDDAVLFHNGVLDDGGIVAPTSSDTQDFVVAMAPLLRKYNKSKARDHFISELTKGNRVLVMYKGGKFKMYGDWKRDGELWVSNLLYKYDYAWSGHGYNKDWYDDWYESYYGTAQTHVDPITGQRTTQRQVTKAEQRAGRRMATLEDESLWATIIKTQYKFVTKDELKRLEDTADWVAGGYMEYGGYEFGYDKSQELVWLEGEVDVLEAPEAPEAPDDTKGDSEMQDNQPSTPAPQAVTV